MSHINIIEALSNLEPETEYSGFKLHHSYLSDRGRSASLFAHDIGVKWDSQYSTPSLYDSLIISNPPSYSPYSTLNPNTSLNAFLSPTVNYNSIVSRNMYPSSINEPIRGTQERNPWTLTPAIATSPFDQYSSPKAVDSLLLKFGIDLPQKLSPLITRLNSYEYDFSHGFGRYSGEVISIQSQIHQLYKKYKKFRDIQILLKIKELKEFQRKEVKDYFKKIRRHIRKEIIKGEKYCDSLLLLLKKKFQNILRRVITRYPLKMISKGSIDEDANASVNSVLTGSNSTSINHLIFLYNEPQRIFNRKSQRNHQF